MSVGDHKMDEVLLRRAFLQSLGFDSKAHFEKVGKLVSGKHVDELEFGAPKAMAASYKGPLYKETDEEPIKLPDVMSAGM